MYIWLVTNGLTSYPGTWKEGWNIEDKDLGQRHLLVHMKVDNEVWKSSYQMLMPVREHPRVRNTEEQSKWKHLAISQNLSLAILVLAWGTDEWSGMMVRWRLCMNPTTWAPTHWPWPTYCCHKISTLSVTEVKIKFFIWHHPLRTTNWPLGDK